MRHRVKTRKLHRDIDARKALIYSLIKAMLENDSIKTHEAKAKYVKRFIEKIVSTAKKDTDVLAKRRLLLSKLRNNRQLVDLALKKSVIYKDIKGGFLRIQSYTKRAGDNSKIVNLSWVVIQKKQKPVKDDLTVKEAPVTKTKKSKEKLSSRKITKVVEKPVKKKEKVK